MQKNHKWVLYALLIQPVLIMMQVVLIYVFKMPVESTTIYRVLLTAVPLVLALIISFKVKPMLFTITYMLAITILLINCVMFPHNEKYIIEGATRFLLPVVIPSALCLLIGITIEQFESVLYKISWFIFFIAVLFCLSYYLGYAYFDAYDMSFGYALLLPMVSLYSKKQYISVLSSIILLLIVLSMGSRGPAFCFIFYVLYDVLINNKKMLLIIAPLFLIFLFYGTELFGFLNSIGIKARTLELLYMGDVMNSSGRDELLETIWSEFEQSKAFLGLGLFGDRSETIVYCHNIIIEIIIGWGWILGIMIIVVGVFLLLRLYIYTDNDNRNKIVKYICALLIPFFASSSYLIDYRMGLFVGLICLLYKQSFKTKRIVAS